MPIFTGAGGGGISWPSELKFNIFLPSSWRQTSGNLCLNLVVVFVIFLVSHLSRSLWVWKNNRCNHSDHHRTRSLWKVAWHWEVHKLPNLWTWTYLQREVPLKPLEAMVPFRYMEASGVQQTNIQRIMLLWQSISVDWCWLYVGMLISYLLTAITRRHRFLEKDPLDPAALADPMRTSSGLPRIARGIIVTTFAILASIIRTLSIVSTEEALTFRSSISWGPFWVWFQCGNRPYS